MSKTVEIYYDFSSPNAYFAVMQLPAVAERTGASIVYKPFLLGGLFRSMGTPDMPGMSTPAKAQAGYRDLQRWSEKHGVPFRYASRFPLNTVKPLRAAIAHERAGGDPRALAEALFTAYWVDDRDISDEAVLREVLEKLGADAEAILAQTADPAIKEALKQNTAEAEQRGAFGAPTFFVGDELFFGKDRIDFVEDELAK